MFISSSIPSGLECWSVNHAATYEKSESKVFKNIKVFGENVRTKEKKIHRRLLNLADNLC